MLYEFIEMNRDEIIRRCRAKVAARSIPPPSEAEIDHGVPLFLDQLTQELRLGLESSTEISKSAIKHGNELLRHGFTVSQVVHDYGDVCQAITDLAVETNAPISTDDFRGLNRCLDDAIAGAVTEYGRARDQSTVDHETSRESERFGYFIHELRNLINTAVMAFDVLKTGNVGVSGSTGGVLHRSLLGLNALIARSVAEVRLTEGVHNPELIMVAPFIEQVASAPVLDATARGLELTVMPVDETLAINGDRQVLAAVVTNLLQNAFKFTQPRTNITLRVNANAESVLIEIQDECGGLPQQTEINALFRPFEQHGMDRTGLGLGLAFSRGGVEANGGRIYARNLPDKGCIFTIDLPRVAVPVAEQP